MNISSTVTLPAKESQSAKIVPFNKTQGSGGDIRGTQTAEDAQRPDRLDEKRTEALRKAEEKNELKDSRTPLEKQKEGDDAKLTEELLEEIAHDFDTLHSIGLNFSRHDDTGRTMVKVMNRDTEELIREIPAKEVLDMAAKMDEMIGLLFDKKV